MMALQLKILLPLGVGILIIVTFLVGMAFLGPQTERVRMEIVEQPLVLVDITQELVGQCSPGNSLLSEFMYCYVDEFSFSDSYGVIYAGRGYQICASEGRVEKISDVFFTFSHTSSAGYCGFRLTVQFEDGEIFFRGVVLEGGPRPEKVTRYELVLANPGNNMPIAGIIYDHETEEVFYIATKSRY